MLRCVLFDYGGVLAEEGFVAGMRAIAAEQGLDPAAFFAAAQALTYDTGFVYGRADEAAWWRALKEATGLTGDEESLREAVLSRFTLRPFMLEAAERVRAMGVKTAILSDQVNWLDMLEARDGFFRHFDQVYNSFHWGLTKRELEFFHLALSGLGCEASEALFIDDNPGHIGRARSLGLSTLLYDFGGPQTFAAAMARELPDFALDAGTRKG